MRFSGSVLRIWVGGVVAILLATASYGQVVTARLSGTVTDQSGASVPGALIKATNARTGVVTQTESDPGGDYLFRSLTPGLYNLSVELSGFKTKLLTGIQLMVAQQVRIDLVLELGEVSEKVVVSAAAPLVESDTATIGTVVSQRSIVDLPLLDRRYGALALLVPGAVPDNGGLASGIPGSPFSETTYAANGNRTSSNNYLIDGGDSYNLLRGGFALQPPPDAIEEFKIQTTAYSAVYGRQGGSTINLVTRSGTNKFHGNAYEFLRNRSLDARNAQAATVPDHKRNQFGFSFGGPIRKDKTFFFTNLEITRDITASSALIAVPDQALKSGDFSRALRGTIINLCGTGGPASLNYDSGQLFDPGTLTRFTCPAGSGRAGQTILTGTPIAGNIIRNIDPVAAKVLSFNPWPEPNALQGGRTANFINTLPTRRSDEQLLVRVDHNFNEKDQISGRYLLGVSLTSRPNSNVSSLPLFAGTDRFHGHNANLTWTHNFGTTLLNSALVGFQRNFSQRLCASCPREEGFMAALGVRNLTAIGPAFEGFPWIQVSGFNSLGDGIYRPLYYPDMVEKYQDNLTWRHGKHTIVIGTDLQYWQNLRVALPYSIYGGMNFNGQYSNLGGLMTGAQGLSGVADFLQGYPSDGSITSRFKPNYFVGGTMTSLYIQDDYKVRNNLVVNLGLRYEYRRPPVDKRDGLTTFVPIGAPFSGPGNAVLVTALPDSENDALCNQFEYLKTTDGRCLIASSVLRSQLGFTGRSRRSVVFVGKKGFAPRIGISWRPTTSDKFIIRTGYGIFYDFLPVENMVFTENNPVQTPTSLYVTTFGAPPPLTNGVPTRTANMFNAGTVTRLSSSLIQSFVAPMYQTPYTQQWSFGISSQLAENWAAEINYVGNKGTHLGRLHYFGNQPLPGVGPLQPRRPYPDFNILVQTTTDAVSNYNSFQAKLTKRFSHGNTLLASYTFQRGINDSEGNEGFGGGNGGNGGAQNDNDWRAERARSYTDARQRFVISYVVDLPFGAGRWLLNRKGWVDAVVGGWAFSGITALQSGFPITIFADQDYSNSGARRLRPDRTCSGVGPRTAQQWFDPSCFTVTPLRDALASGRPQVGNSGRNILDGPGSFTWQGALFKTFTFSERYSLQFRGEAFGLLNHPNLGNPIATIGPNVTNIGRINSSTGQRNAQVAMKLFF